MRFKNLKGRKYISGYDTFLRHRCLSKLIEKFNPSTILDVGGESALNLFVSGSKVYTANVKNADIVCSGTVLPVKTNSIDVAVSADTLEHLHKSKRVEFCNELYRVSRRGFILCAPLGTDEHISFEKSILVSHKLYGTTSSYLTQHVEFGLPSPEEVADIVKDFEGNVFYQGDFRTIKQAGNRLSTYVQMAANTVRNIISEISWSHDKYLEERFHPYTNRFFILVNKSNKSG